MIEVKETEVIDQEEVIEEIEEIEVIEGEMIAEVETEEVEVEDQTLDQCLRIESKIPETREDSLGQNQEAEESAPAEVTIEEPTKMLGMAPEEREMTAETQDE